MRDFTHYVVTSNSTAGLGYISPLNGTRDLPPFPQRMVRWGCAGPCLIAWGHTVVTHKPLPDELFIGNQTATKLRNPIGNWFRKRRDAILHP
jgi:hypothetical protein